MVKNLLAKQETWVQYLGPEDPLEEEMATHSHSSILAWRIPWTEESGANILAWEIPWTEEPSRLQSMGS